MITNNAFNTISVIRRRFLGMLQVPLVYLSWTPFLNTKEGKSLLSFFFKSSILPRRERRKLSLLHMGTVKTEKHIVSLVIDASQGYILCAVALLTVEIMGM